MFRKVMSSDDMIQDFAPALRTNSQAESFRIALQMLGDLCGFGISYFDFDDSRGYVKTAAEVSSDNSALMRNIARHEHALEVSLANISKAVMQVSRGFGVSIPDEGAVRVEFDDSIVQDTAALKAQDMAEVDVTLAPRVPGGATAPVKPAGGGGAWAAANPQRPSARWHRWPAGQVDKMKHCKRGSVLPRTRPNGFSKGLGGADL